MVPFLHSPPLKAPNMLSGSAQDWAREKVGTEFGPTGYEWDCQNCEHFATWCFYNKGEGQRAQVQPINGGLAAVQGEKGWSAANIAASATWKLGVVNTANRWCHSVKS